MKFKADTGPEIGRGVITHECVSIEIETPEGDVLITQDPKGRLMVKKKPDPNAPKRGKFIVLEGVDGAGTTTQSKLLTSYLTTKNLSVCSTSEPTRSRMDTPTGQLIDEILHGKVPKPDKNALALLFAADRVNHYQSEIEGALAAGNHVICDRYLLSGISYDSAAGCDPEWVALINRYAPSPDLVVFVAMDTDVAIQRIKKRDGESVSIYENFEFLNSVEDRYRRLAHSLKSEGLNIEIIDGGGSIRVIAAVIADIVDDLLEEVIDVESAQ